LYPDIEDLDLAFFYLFGRYFLLIFAVRIICIVHVQAHNLAVSQRRERMEKEGEDALERFEESRPERRSWGTREVG
jgi:hypothetical protein